MENIVSLPLSYPILMRPLCRRGSYFVRPLCQWGMASVPVWIPRYLLTSVLWSYDLCVACVPLVQHILQNDLEVATLYKLGTS